MEGRRRAPDKAVLHEVFRRGWPEVSSSMPTRVKREVERYLTCGDPRFGFVEVRCEDCAESRVVAFCCKGRGWCPSCTTRRALDTGVHLESVLPRVAHREWRLSLPIAVRFLVVKKPKRLKHLEVRLVLCKYGGRGPVAERRLRRLDDGRYQRHPDSPGKRPERAVRGGSLPCSQRRGPSTRSFLILGSSAM